MAAPAGGRGGGNFARLRSAFPGIAVPASILEAGWHSAHVERESEAEGRARVGRIVEELRARARALASEGSRAPAAAAAGPGGGHPTDAASRETGAVTAASGPSAAAACAAVAFVAHGDFLNLLVQSLLGVPAGNGVQFSFHNASISVVDVYASGVVVLARMNAVGHMDAADVTPPWNAV